jgi:hypothetical protein
MRQWQINEIDKCTPALWVNLVRSIVEFDLQVFFFVLFASGLQKGGGAAW